MMNKKFDCVKMTRDIRDTLYHENKGRSLKEFAEMLAKDAHKSDLWKNIKVLSKLK